MIESDEKGSGRNREELSALIDGELAPERLAAVAAWIAEDNEAARAFATLAALKARTTATLRTNDLPSPRRSGREVRTFVALALVAVLGASLVLALSTREAPKDGGSRLQSIAQTQSRLHTAELQIPNLDAANLRLERVSFASDTRPTRADAFYIGERGCRVRLTITERGAPEDAVPATSQVARWTVGDFAYRLTGEQLDTERFATTVALAEAGSRSPGSMMVASASGPLMGRPCLG